MGETGLTGGGFGTMFRECSGGRRMGEKEDNEIPKGPDWLTSPAWWIGIILFGVGLYLTRHFFS
jgi:hypothetical protein